jgi:alkylation response protein AidB-like acyl-CoA dehydrogenase
MDFSWNTDQLALRAAVIEFAQQALEDDVLEREPRGEFSRENWRKCADFGIQSMAIPGPYNSSGITTDFLSAVLAMEAMGYGCRDTGLTFALNTQMWTVAHPVLEFGTEEQKNRFLPAICRGDRIGAHALTEPESGSDAFSLRTTARKTEGGYILNGKKKFITLGPIADFVLLFATLDPALGNWGITGFLVDAKSPGLERGEMRSKMGLRTVPMGDLTLTDCFVPEADRLGPEGAGASISNNSLELERCSILASQLGAMQRQLEEAIQYARERHQFKRPIGKFQSVSNRIVDMKLRLETSRLLLYHVAWLEQSGRPAMLEAALLKLCLSESFLSSSLDAIRTFGGNGYLPEYHVERDLRDAVGGVLYAGTTDIQRMVVARLLGL